ALRLADDLAPSWARHRQARACDPLRELSFHIPRAALSGRRVPVVVAAGNPRNIGNGLEGRITHHANILKMNGDSYRLAQSRARKAGGGLPGKSLRRHETTARATPSQRSHACAASGRLLRRPLAGFCSAVDTDQPLIDTLVGAAPHLRRGGAC